MNDFRTFGRRLEPHLRAWFGATAAEGPSRVQGAALRATGAQKRWPGRRAPSRPAPASAVEELARAGDPAGQGVRRAHRYRNDLKTQKPPTNRILNLFLICSWTKNPLGNQESLFRLPQSMLSFTYPCHWASSFRRSVATLPRQVKQEQITLC